MPQSGNLLHTWRKRKLRLGRSFPCMLGNQSPNSTSGSRNQCTKRLRENECGSKRDRCVERPESREFQPPYEMAFETGEMIHGVVREGEAVWAFRLRNVPPVIAMASAATGKATTMSIT